MAAQPLQCGAKVVELAGFLKDTVHAGRSAAPPDDFALLVGHGKEGRWRRRPPQDFDQRLHRDWQGVQIDDDDVGLKRSPLQQRTRGKVYERGDGNVAEFIEPADERGAARSWLGQDEYAERSL